MADYVWPDAKDPAAVKFYFIDWSDWLGAADLVGEAVWDIPAASGLIKSSQRTQGDKTFIWFDAGGNPGVYDIACTATDSDGRSEPRTVQIKVSST